VGASEDEAGGVGMKRGYVFTLLTSMFLMLILSLSLFQSNIYSPRFEDSTSKMQVDRLHSFADSIRDDASRAVSISAQRGAAYAISHIIRTNESFRNYNMGSCGDYIYDGVGIEAALAELIVCGNLSNAQNYPEDIDSYMQNNTILFWVERIGHPEGTFKEYNVSLEFKGLEMGLISAWKLAILSEYDIRVCDEGCENRYVLNRIPVVSVVDISSLEDPIYQIQTEGVANAYLRTFKKCEETPWKNATLLEEIIEDGCYMEGDDIFMGPSFLDRLENRTTLDRQRFSFDKWQFHQKIGVNANNISLHSLLNIRMLSEHGLDVNVDYSHVDYYFWNERSSIPGENCFVDGMSEHPGFRIDVHHARFHRVRGLNCHVILSNTSSLPEDFRFRPTHLSVPNNTTITFIDATGSQRTLYDSKMFPEGKTLPALGNIHQYYAASALPGENYHLYDSETLAEFHLFVER
jgi:hypothetical protein